MTLEIQNQTLFLEELQKIANKLIEMSILDNENGRYWKTIKYLHGDYIYAESQNLYSGVAGIGLFFIEMYCYDKGEEYIQVAVESANWLERHVWNTINNSQNFFTGSSGIAYFFSRLYSVTHDDKYLSLVNNISLKGAVPIDGSQCDLLTGVSGSIIGLLHINEFYKNDYLLSHINELGNYIITSCVQSKSGLYWDRSKNTINGLCGFSHGVSGVCFALDELYAKTQMDSYRIIALEAKRYERDKYSLENRCWPDFRNSFFDNMEFELFSNAYRNGDKKLFTSPSMTNAWCHGGVGIGCSRLNSWRLFNNILDYEEYRIALDSILPLEDESAIETMSLTLCHGLGSVVEFLLQAAEVDKSIGYYDRAVKLMLRGILHSRRLGSYRSGFNSVANEDASLFMGVAGVGYQILRLLDPNNTPSILLPTVKKVSPKVKSDVDILKLKIRTKSDVYYNLSSQLFPRTLSVLTTFDSLNLFLSTLADIDANFDPTIPIQITIDTIRGTRSLAEYAIVNDIFQLELTKLKIDQAVESLSLLNIEIILQMQELNNILDRSWDEVSNIKVVVNPRVVSYESSYCWAMDQKHDLTNRDRSFDVYTHGSFQVLFLPTPETVLEFWPNQFVLSFIDIFSSPLDLNTAYQRFLNIYCIMNSDANQYQEIFYSQWKELLNARVLLEQASYLDVLKISRKLMV